jgi:hypothetical protein
MLLVMGPSASFVSQPVNAEETDDPFAMMDAISVGITTEKTSSISSPPTTTNDNDTKNLNSGNDRSTMNSSTKSDMDAALEESRRRRTIDPRTHG